MKELINPSKIAFEKSKDFKERHQKIILESLKKFGEMNAEQIAKKCSLDRYQIGRRLKEMVIKNLIEVTKRKPFQGKILTHYKTVQHGS